LVKFLGDCLWDEDLSVKGGQEVGLTDEDQVAKRGGIGDNDTGHGLKTEAKVSLTVLFEILPGVIEPDLVVFEEAVEFVAGNKAEEAAELGGREFAFAVSFEGDGLEGSAGRVVVEGG
jgi:hypothetical protein